MRLNVIRLDIMWENSDIHILNHHQYFKPACLVWNDENLDTFESLDCGLWSRFHRVFGHLKWDLTVCSVPRALQTAKRRLHRYITSQETDREIYPSVIAHRLGIKITVTKSFDEERHKYKVYKMSNVCYLITKYKTWKWDKFLIHKYCFVLFDTFIIIIAFCD